MGQLLVTGASGFIGRNLMEIFRVDGLEPVAWVRNAKSASVLAQSGNPVEVGDLHEASEFVKRNPSIETVVHLASIVAPYDKSKTFDVNVGLTKDLASSCSERSNPPTFIYVSSLSASGPCIDGIARRETDACSPCSWYGESKAAAEVALRQFAHKMPISVVRPPAVIGPWDRNLLQMFQTVKRGWNLVGISKNYQYSFVHVADLARGIKEIIKHGSRLCVNDEQVGTKVSNQSNTASGIYFVADPHSLTFVDLGNYVAKSMNIGQPRHVVVPRIVCKSVAMISEIGGRYLGMRTYLNLDKIREAEAGSWVCDTRRAKEELGYAVQVPLHQRVVETAQWYRDHRWI